MRKGLISYLIMLCILIVSIVGCQDNPSSSHTPVEIHNQTTTLDLSTPTDERNVTIEYEDLETETEFSGETNPTLITTDSVREETDTQATEPPITEPFLETIPPVTEEAEKTESKPTELPPTAPLSTDPKPTDSQVTEPPVTESAEYIDLNALVQYGRNYAANTYGYEVTPGLRDGYYPAYTCVISTMEEGRAAVRGCIDDTTRALLAVPGTQIVVEIDGVLCRARIDIAIVPKDEGTYLVSVYYG